MNVRAMCGAVTLACAVGAVGAHVAGAVPSEAEKAAALAAVREGNRLLDGGQAQGALAKFLEAHRLVGGDKLQFNLAQAHRAIPGHEVEAYQAYQTFLDRVTGAAPDTLAAARTEQAQVRTRLALLTVKTMPAGAQCQVDGRPIGETPLVLPLLPGTHTLSLRLAGQRAVDDVIVVAAGQAVDKDVALESLQPVARERPVLVAPGPAARIAAPEPGPSLAEPARKPDAPPIYRKPWFWGVAGAAIVGTLTVMLATRHTETRLDCGGRPCALLK